MSITLYILAWPENPAPVVLNSTTAAPIVTSTMAGPTGNTLHSIGAIAASFFLPLGCLGMSLLGMRRAPSLATISAAISLIGWIPWSALIGILLGRLRLVPVWAAWAFALTSPLTMAYFATHVVVVRYVLRDQICALWIVGAIPAALAMLRNKDLALPAPPAV